MLTLCLDAFVERIHQDIPLTAAMHWQIDQIDNQGLKASAPLTPNINDKGTFFGGSSSALMTISGWAFIKFNLEQRGLQHDVVIHKNQNAWLKPQNDTLHMSVEGSQTIDWSQVSEKLSQNKNIRIRLQCQAGHGDDVTTTMKADYAIIADR